MTYDSQFASTLKKVIDEHIDFLSEQLKTGAIQSMEDYREKTGQIRGLNKAIEFFEDAEKILQQR